MPTANGQPLIFCEIRMPRIGPWTADLVADVAGEGALDAFGEDDDGRVRVELEHAGAVFRGTATRSGVQGERFAARLVGGRGGLSRELPSRNYEASAGVKVRTVLDDILRETGEMLSSSADAAVLDARVPRWTRAAGPATAALGKLAAAARASWRVLRDGTVWLGRDAYPEASPAFVLLGDDDYASGAQVLGSAGEDDAGPLTLDPGVTFRGRRAERVVHRLQNSTLRTEVYETTAAGALQGALAPQARELAYSRRYSARVSEQHEDGTVQVVPEDATIAGAGLDKVRIRLGVPGSVLVPKGTRCLLEFEAGDPSRPLVTGFGAGAVAELRLGAGSEALALASRVEDALDALKSAIQNAATGANDGGAAFKLNLLNALADWPPAVGSERLFGE